MNRCITCKELFEGHVACPHCGGYGYHDLDTFAGLVIRGETFKHQAMIRASGAKFDAARKEWVVPAGITGVQFDALSAVLDCPELRTGFYENPADYDVGPAPDLAHQ